MDKVYLVTGASSDIGMAFIRDVAAKYNNAEFFAHYRTESIEMAALQNEFPNRITPIKADLSDINAVISIIETVKSAKKIPTHILHLPAGRIRHVRFNKTRWEDINEEIHVSVHSLFEVLKEFLPVMANNRYGKVVVMLTSCTKNMPPKFLANYTIAKYTLMGLMKSAAAEYEGKGLFINGISPDMVETKFLSNLDERIVELNASNSAKGHNLAISEVVAGINFLLSDDINCMTGENLFL